MPGLLARSKSMRLLRSHRKDVQQRDAQKSMPQPDTSKTETDRYQPATPVSRKERLVETPDLAVRPSTSGGVHLKTDQVASIHSYQDLNFSFPSNPSMVLSAPQVTDSSEGIIGIALGSPTHWDKMSQFSQPYSPAPSVVPTEAPKSKLGRWKSLFRKPAPPPPRVEKPPFYQLTTTITATRANRADSHHDEEPEKEKAEPGGSRDIGRTPSPPTFKTSIRASRTFTTPRSAPDPPQSRPRAFTAGSLPANPRVSVVRSATTPLPSHMVAQNSPAVPKLLASQSTSHVPTLPGDTPVLDVSIPDIKLDRYSVMFGNLLQPTSSRSSSLLVRRQGNHERLKPLNKLSVKDDEQESPIDYRLQRRATSPRMPARPPKLPSPSLAMPSPSPRLSLFPSTNNSRAASPRSSSVPRYKTLQRSQTEKSPLHQTFSQNEVAKGRAQDLFNRKPAASPHLKARESMNLQVQQLAMTPNSIRSFESDTDSVTIVVGSTAPGQTHKLHLDDREPEWEICSKPTPVARSSTMPLASLVRTDSQPKVTKLSALSSHPSSAPLEAPSPLQRIQQLQSPPHSAKHAISPLRETEQSVPKAMVGVARSVSVSRATSPRTLVRTGSQMRSPKDRMIDSQALTPTVVEVMNRKSQRVQLEDA
ncbi:hypothetical protein DE146DRAFT_485391 [Phaeosphaeria sp. MPI-PUGE-AT-0046c]|nr:hypothetical protein DE146DRAFT_485391 [Phaeosphaeria sp. MPI-PUGE-AT-0046c]